MMLGWMNCQSASAASARRFSSSSEKLEHRGLLEEVAVEVPDLVLPEGATGGHDGEEFLHRRGEVVRVVEAELEQVGKEVGREQAGVLGEEAEDEAVQEAGDAEILALGEIHLGAGLGVGELDGLALLEGLGDLGDVAGERLGDLGGGADGLERFRVGEERAEDAPVLRVVEAREVEVVDLLHRAVEIGADDEILEVADDEQRRVKE
jgi:hypothetical protein